MATGGSDLILWRLGCPYADSIRSVTRPGLERACRKWLMEVGLFRDSADKRELAGVTGTFREHLARMMSMAQPMLVPVSDPIFLLQCRQAATWTDERTLDAIDAALTPHVYFETFAPEVLIKMRIGAGGPQWWIESSTPEEDRMPVIVSPAVEKIIARGLSRHLGHPPTAIRVTLGADWVYPYFDNDRDQPTSGFYEIRIVYGAGAESK